MLAARRRLVRDERLVALIRAGDEQAFGVLQNRYRAALLRYARRLLAGTGHDPQVVVEDALAQAHTVLLSSRKRPMAIHGWLFALTRNRAIDELRRHLPEAAATDDRPRSGLLRGQKRRHLIADLSELPETQVVALLGRELDGRSHVSLAGELGISETATRMRVVRARESLINVPRARNAECANVRLALDDAHRRGTRPTEQVREHLQTCDECSVYRASLRRLDRRLPAVAPGAAATALAATARVLGVGGPAALVAKAVVFVGVLAVVVGAAVLIASHDFGGGKPSPLRVVGTSNVKGHDLVRVRIRVAAGPRDRNAEVTLHCPTGLAYATIVGGAGSQRAQLQAAPDTLRGARGALHFHVIGPALPKPATIAASILCKRPGAPSSLEANTQLVRRGDRRERVCVKQAIFGVRPGGPYRGVAVRGDPVAVLRGSASQRYVHIRTGDGTTGWARATQISSHGRCR